MTKDAQPRSPEQDGQPVENGHADEKQSAASDDSRRPRSAAAQAFPDPSQLLTAAVATLDDIRDNCLIVLDTSVLLLPYGVGGKSLEEIRERYRRLAEAHRLIIPAQVAQEYAKNRPIKLVELFATLSNQQSRLEAPSAGKYPLLEAVGAYQELLKLEGPIAEQLDRYRQLLGRLLEQIRAWGWNDPVSLMYRELFNDPGAAIFLSQELCAR
jgi:hypothetical protein